MIKQIISRFAIPSLREEIWKRIESAVAQGIKLAYYRGYAAGYQKGLDEYGYGKGN
jgi:hypothetical protein